MNVLGRLTNFWWDSRRKKTLIQFEVPEDMTDVCEALGAKDLNIRAYPQSRKRSLNANALYWKLTGKIAEKMKISTARVHNLHLRDCGYRAEIDGKVVEVLLPDVDDDDILERTTFHIVPTDTVLAGSDGEKRVYHLLRGSRTFNREEMSRLIDMTMEEAKSLGIETLSPEEFERMMAAYHEANNL